MKNNEASAVYNYLDLVDRAKSAGLQLVCKNANFFYLDINGTMHRADSLSGVSSFLKGVEAGTKRAREM